MWVWALPGLTGFVVACAAEVWLTGWTGKTQGELGGILVYAAFKVLVVLGGYEALDLEVLQIHLAHDIHSFCAFSRNQVPWFKYEK